MRIDHLSLAFLLSLTVLLAGCSSNRTRREAEASHYSVEGEPSAPQASAPQGRVESQSFHSKPWEGAASAQKVQPREQEAPVHDTEEYAPIEENAFTSPRSQPLSTFSIDVDGASYANVRRFLMDNRMPYAGAVRIEEMVNYFDYDYPQPQGEHPFSISTEVAACPWNEAHQLVHVGLQGQQLDTEELPPSNLVFLLDVSGSMNSPDKLPLLQSGFRLLVDQLDEKDRVAIVVYAGAAGLVLPSTPASEKSKILDAIDQLSAGGSTAGGAGIQLAYQTAQEHFIPEGNNRVILATDGDFNVGTSSTSELVQMVEQKRESGVFFSVLGFGTGNLKDARMEQLADQGNGNYYYIDNILEAKKVLVEEMGGTLYTIAKDVKIQVEFNPNRVKGYRLIGYENRLLAAQDFNDDTKDAGELGAGHTVTALYEIVPVGAATEVRVPDDLRYQQPGPATGGGDEWLFVKFRYKAPDGDQSQRMEQALPHQEQAWTEASDDFRFSAAVAAFGMLLRDSEHRGSATYALVKELAQSARGDDPHGYRQAFMGLVERASLLDEGQLEVER